MRTIVIFLMISVLGTTAHSQELNLPDPLIAQDGTVIDTASKWGNGPPARNPGVVSRACVWTPPGGIR